MTTPASELRPLIEDVLVPDQWTTLQEIYAAVAAKSSFAEEDEAPAKYRLPTRGDDWSMHEVVPVV